MGTISLHLAAEILHPDRTWLQQAVNSLVIPDNQDSLLYWINGGTAAGSVDLDKMTKIVSKQLKKNGAICMKVIKSMHSDEIFECQKSTKIEYISEELSNHFEADKAVEIKRIRRDIYKGDLFHGTKPDYLSGLPEAQVREKL